MSASEIHICANCGYSERDPFDRQREEALELVRIARMSMNPKVNAGWFERADKLLKEVGVDHTEAVDG